MSSAEAASAADSIGPHHTLPCHVLMKKTILALNNLNPAALRRAVDIGVFIHCNLSFAGPPEIGQNRRRQKLRALAKSSAARAKSQRGQVSLSPMSAYERRIIHITLVDDDEVMTHSEGEEPNRHVVITALKKQ